MTVGDVARSSEEIRRHLLDALGTASISPSVNEHEDIDGMRPLAVATPQSREEVSAVVSVCERLGLAIVPRGNSTHLHVGNPPLRCDVVLATTGMDGVLQHDAADMTVTVEAGTTLEALDGVLRRAGQWLPLDPPWPESVTIGGLVAADLNGSLRLSHGKVRDYLIGVRVVVGGGSVVRGGGQVVKNVAGYDIPKLMIGSFGSLGVVVEATFKVRPRPASDVTLAAAEPTIAAAFERVNAISNGPLAPYAVDVLNASAAATVGLGVRPLVLVRLGGEETEVREQLDRLRPILPNADRVPPEVLVAVRDFPIEGPGIAACRLCLLPAQLAEGMELIEREAKTFGVEMSAQIHAGSGVARLRLGSVDEGDPPKLLAFLRWLHFLARQRCGFAVIEQAPLAVKQEVDVWGPSPNLELMRRVKQAFDPRSTFSPGRFVGRI